MVKIEEHKKKIEEIKNHISNSRGNQKRQYIKCLHRLEKELNECQLYISNEIKRNEVEAWQK